MRTAVKYIVGKTWRPVITKYLTQTRIYRYGEIELEVPPTVFHPGFFFSTKLLLQPIKKLALKDQSFLELGAGSGLISVYAAKNKAIVTATDINPGAIECLGKNSRSNNV